MADEGLRSAEMVYTSTGRLRELRSEQDSPPGHKWTRGDDLLGREARCSCGQNPCPYHEPYSFAMAGERP
jgi:hypothetical protein